MQGGVNKLWLRLLERDGVNELWLQLLERGGVNSRWLQQLERGGQNTPLVWLLVLCGGCPQCSYRDLPPN